MILSHLHICLDNFVINYHGEFYTFPWKPQRSAMKDLLKNPTVSTTKFLSLITFGPLFFCTPHTSTQRAKGLVVLGFVPGFWSRRLVVQIPLSPILRRVLKGLCSAESLQSHPVDSAKWSRNSDRRLNVKYPCQNIFSFSRVSCSWAVKQVGIIPTLVR